MLSITYPVVREATALSYYIRKVYKSVGFPIPPREAGNEIELRRLKSCWQFSLVAEKAIVKWGARRGTGDEKNKS